MSRVDLQVLKYLQGDRDMLALRTMRKAYGDVVILKSLNKFLWH